MMSELEGTENKKDTMYSLYFNKIIEWQSKMNLMSRKEIEKGYTNFIDAHILDALAIQTIFKDIHIRSIIDVGSGAGIPGIPLAIEDMQREVVLVESIKKKALFLESTAESLNLKRVMVVNQRAEEFSHTKTNRERYDLSTIRAVGSITESLELAIPFVKVNGVAALWRGEESAEDIEFSTIFAESLCGKLEKVVEYSLLALKKSRIIMIFRKFAPTPEIYPRKAKMLGKYIEKPIINFKN